MGVMMVVGKLYMNVNEKVWKLSGRIDKFGMRHLNILHNVEVDERKGSNE